MRMKCIFLCPSVYHGPEMPSKHKDPYLRKRQGSVADPYAEGMSESEQNAR